MSGFPLGSRVNFLSCSDRCPTIARKVDLWSVSAERRGGILIDRSTYMGAEYHVIVLDEPLNEDCWDIDDSVADLYVSPSIPNAKKHILLVPLISVANGDIVMDVAERYKVSHRGRAKERELARSAPREMGICQRCKKAQINRNLLFTCSLYNHTMCKKCLVNWDERTNRANMQDCAKYTAQMKQYCQDKMGYEPTYLPTRVLLGFYYWQTEDEQKAVEEFLEFDYWVCWVCRFCSSHYRRNSEVQNGDKHSEKFEFIHEQLFPFGSESEASQILDNNERDLFARFGASMASPSHAVTENALRIKEDITLNVYCPAEYLVYKVECLKKWSLANIFNEILEVTGTTYNSDLVMYSIDRNGWEVELCDLRENESSEEAMSGGVAIMTCIRDLRDSDYLVLRMRTNHIIGARSHLEILGVLEPKFFDAVQNISKIYAGFRRIGGDGNCYYRAVAFGLLEQLVLQDEREKLGHLYGIFATVSYEAGSAEDYAHSELLEVLDAASTSRSWLDADQLQKSFLDKSNPIDEALVRACRSLLSTYLIRNEAQVTGNGLPLKECILSVCDDVSTMEDYCEKYIRRMGEDAEGAFLEMGLLPSLLGAQCVIHNLDIYSAQKEIECPYTNIFGECIGSVNILLRPGHYDLLYPMGMTFSPPIRAPRAPSSGAARAKDEKEYKEVDLLTGDDMNASGPETNGTPVKMVADAKPSERVSGLSELLEMCPDMGTDFAVKLLKRCNFNVADAVNEYFTNQEVYSSATTEMLLDLDADAKYVPPPTSHMRRPDVVPSNSAAKDRTYEQLRREMPDVALQDLHDAVHQGNATNASQVRSYISGLSDARYYDTK